MMPAESKHALVLCCLTLVFGCARQNARVGTEPPSGQIGTDRLIDAFITYVHKAEGDILDVATREEMRRELQQAKDDPLLAPYVFEGGRFDRKAIMDEIAQAKAKWLDSDMPLSRTARYAFEPSNLKTLSAAELVIAMRLVNQVTSKMK